MSKELKTLREIKAKYQNDNGLLRRLDIIETALEDYEVVCEINTELAKQNNKMKQERLANKKKLKAFEIIKKVVKYDIEVNGNDIFDIEYEPNEMLTQEEFDLLKEVLV